MVGIDDVPPPDLASIPPARAGRRVRGCGAGRLRRTRHAVHAAAVAISFPIPVHDACAVAVRNGTPDG
jgi:hypothetical protein